jgi:hypothetical protein
MKLLHQLMTRLQPVILTSMSMQTVEAYAMVRKRARVPLSQSHLLLPTTLLQVAPLLSKAGLLYPSIPLSRSLAQACSLGSPAAALLGPIFVASHLEPSRHWAMAVIVLGIARHCWRNGGNWSRRDELKDREKVRMNWSWSW